MKSADMKDLFLNIVKRAKNKYSFKLHGFTIMSNHIHFMIRPGRNESLAQIMQWILSVFAICFNKLFNLKGHVWYDRYKSTIIHTYEQLTATFRYICNNPVKAKMVKTPKDYKHGSLWFILHKQFDLVEPPDLLLICALPELFNQILITD